MENKYLSQIISQTGGQDRSIRWFQQKIKEAGGPPTQKQLLEEGNRTLDIQLGKMYFYVYNPKHKKTLPYYDRFPLVIPFDEDNKYFTGLNFHYISIPYRLALIEQLLKFSRDYQGDQRMIFEWRQIKRLRETRPTVKKYLKQQVRSRFIELTEEEIKLALLLPVHDFKKATIQKVYYDSRRKINS